jgi:hypothetical protein
LFFKNKEFFVLFFSFIYKIFDVIKRKNIIAELNSNKIIKIRTLLLKKIDGVQIAILKNAKKKPLFNSRSNFKIIFKIISKTNANIIITL